MVRHRDGYGGATSAELHGDVAAPSTDFHEALLGENAADFRAGPYTGPTQPLPQRW